MNVWDSATNTGHGHRVAGSSDSEVLPETGRHFLTSDVGTGAITQKQALV